MKLNCGKRFKITRMKRGGAACVLALTLTAPAFALDLPTCDAGEYLWLMTAGNPAGTLMPRADMRVGTVTFQDWTDGSTTFRTAQFTNVPRGNLGAAKTFERYSGGGDLGSFSKNWPISIGDIKRGALQALPPGNPPPSAPGGEYPSNFASSNLIDGASGQTLAQVLSDPAFNGQITYIAPSAARIDFVTLALCTSALPQKAPQTVSTGPAASPPSETSLTESERIAARIAELKAAKDKEDTLAIVQARAEAARLAAEEETKRLREIEAAKQEEIARLAALREAEEAQGRLEAQRIEEARLEEERLEKERLENELLEQERRKTAAAAEAPISNPLSKPAETSSPPSPHLLQSESVKTQTKRDLLTSAAMAGSAILNLAAQGLGNILRARSGPSPTPGPSPSPLPIHASAGGSSTCKREDDWRKEDWPDDVPDMPEDIPEDIQAAPMTAHISAATQPSATTTSPQAPSLDMQKDSKKSVIIPGSATSTGPISTTNSAILAAYDAVGRIGYPHAARAARDARDLGYGSAILIAPDKVLTNYHVWKIIENKSGIGVEFNAREGETLSEFITLKSKTPQVLEGMDAVVLTLSRRLPRTPIWPCDMDYGAPDIEAREVIAIGHPVKPQGSGYLLQQAVLEAFGEDPLWNVKRHSRGLLTVHTQDGNGDILYEVPVHADIHPSTYATALCHRATTIGGFSGGAIICAQTGDFLGLHFGGQFLDNEDINYAVPGRALISGLAAIGLGDVPTSIRSSEVVTITPTQTKINLEPGIASGNTQTGDLFEFAEELNDDPKNEENEENEAPTAQTSKSRTDGVSPETFTEYLIEKDAPLSPHALNGAAPDDLTLIEGIGPKTAKALHDHGIRSFKALSQGSPYDLLPVLEAAGLPRRDPTTWPAQAALAASGDWDRLKDWQDKLHGGREVS